MFGKVLILLIEYVLAKLTNVPQEQKLTNYSRIARNDATKELLQTVSDLLDLTIMFGKNLILLKELVIAKLTHFPQRQKLTNYRRTGGNEATEELLQTVSDLLDLTKLFGKVLILLIE
jgi:hypothetical protein